MKKSENCKDQPVRVLHVLSGLNSGGAESFIMNMYRHMDRSKVQFDFLLRSRDNIFESELQQMGSNVYITASFPRHFIQNTFQTYSFFKNHRYDIVHVHANALLYMTALQCARLNGVNCRIIHSHNSAMAHMKLLPIHNFNKKHIQKLATDYFACSDSAGKWMFENQFVVISNAIDTDAFDFNVEKRNAVRRELGIDEETLVIGNIGRFTDQKNHAFLVDTFYEIVRQRPASELLLVGDGPLNQEIRNRVQKLNLSDNVRFLGVRNDVSSIINAFDVFAFPSLYEGFPVAIVEAQANGLKIFCSEAVSQQALFLDSAQVVSLTLGPKYWAKCILDADKTRIIARSKIEEAGFNVRVEAKKLQDFYLSKIDGQLET